MTNAAYRTKRPYLDIGNPLAKHIICALPFYEGAGTVARDISGRRTYATIVGAAWETEGLGFNGTSDYCEIINANRLPALNAPKTILFRAIYDGTSSRRILLSLVTAGTASINLEFGSFAFKAVQWGGGAIVSTTVPTEDVFHDYCYTFDGVASTLYIDGKYRNTSTTAMGSGGITTGRIGSFNAAFPSPYANRPIGRVAIFDSALSPSQVRELYRNPNYLWGPASRLAPYLIQDAGGGTTVTPSPVSATWSIPSPTLIKTRTIVPVSATWSTPTPTLRKSRTVEPVTATWATPSPTLAKSITPDPVGASWTVNTTTLTKSITPDPVVATWTVTTPTTGNQTVVTPDPITATWSIPSITVTKTVYPQPVSTSWQLPSPTLVKTRSVSPVVTTWTTTAPTLTKTTSPSTVSATWTVTALTTSKIVRPSPVLVTWAIADPTTSHDNPAPTLIRFTSETFSNPAMTNETWAIPKFLNETFTE